MVAFGSTIRATTCDERRFVENIEKAKDTVIFKSQFHVCFQKNLSLIRPTSLP